MKQQTQSEGSWARHADVGRRVEPVFFFDGDFRTWAQVEHRAKLNMAIATYVAAHPVR